uniref:Transmembrane protein 35 n=1 Tax=Aceria tosichella TaxID=561515 RepID=A0A6G1SCK5_9ACAR
MAPSLSKTPTATNVAIYTLGALLGFIHVFIAVIALTPLISSDYYRELELNYNAFAKVLLSFYSFGVSYDTVGRYFRILFSSLQAVFGVALLENGYYSGTFGKFGNYGLIALDVVVLAFQYRVGISYERLAPTIVFLILLAARAIIVEQSQKRVRPGVKTRNAGKTKSSPKKNKNE